MKIGLYFGSFNPIHTGHLIIANHILNTGIIEKLWFVVSPLNPFKHNSTLLNEYDRFHLIQLATENDPRVKVSEIEFQLPKPSYTINTLVYLQERYPQHKFSIIMGSDSFKNLHRWKNAEAITSNYPIIVYKRPGFEIENSLQANVYIAEAPLLEISATRIRELIKTGKSIRYLVPDKVKDEIETNRYYRK